MKKLKFQIDVWQFLGIGSAVIGIIIINLVNTDTNSENMEEETTSPILKKSRNMMIGFYNVENLFDIYDDPNTFDEEFTPFGKKKWDNERYQRKIEDISSVIADFSNKTNPTLMGLAEVENFDVIKDLIKSKSLFNTNYKIKHLIS